MNTSSITYISSSSDAAGEKEASLTSCENNRWIARRRGMPQLPRSAAASPPKRIIKNRDEMCENCTYIRNHPSSVVISVIVFCALVGVALALSFAFMESREARNYDTAVDLAMKTGSDFSAKLDMAILPLFSIAQFATELDLFADLPNRIGPATTTGLPFLKNETTGLPRPYRNVTGICDQPELVERYNSIASAVKRHAKMDGILHNLQLAPYGVICLVTPINNTEDFEDGKFLDSSGVLGFDVLNSPSMEFIARSSMKSGELGIAGPRPVAQCPSCGLYFIARLPITSDSSVIELDGQKYPRWGFATALINWNALVKKVLPSEHFEDNGFEFQLTRTDRTFNEDKGTYDENVVVLVESDHYGSKMCTARVALETTDNEWVITVQYDEDFNKPLLISISVLLPFFISCLVFTVLVQKQMHDDMVRSSSTQEARLELERQITAYFSHELRNPLFALCCALESMPKDLPAEAMELITGMKLCSSFMSNIMNNLLDARKIEEGKMILRSVPFSLEKLVRDVRTMKLPAVAPGVELNVIAETNGRDYVLGDVHRVQQVLSNLVTNSIKYTRSGSITIYVGWEGDNVRMECRDTGPGIPKDEQENLCERFVMRGGAPGSGLGLAIVRQLVVDLMNGSIRFESDPIAKPGTNCIVLLPLVPATDTDQLQPVESAVESLIEEPIRILIIDDVKINRSMLTRRMQKTIAPNSIISQASTGEEALRICETETFDVIIVDQFMEEAGGVMVGTDVVAAMRRLKVDSFIIGFSGNDVAREFIAAGADLAWQKPLPPTATIIRQLRQRRPTNSFFGKECLDV